jgi:argininosuccinate synthase
VLASFGRLDTSIILKGFMTEYGAGVSPSTADPGQGAQQIGLRAPGQRWPPA